MELRWSTRSVGLTAQLQALRKALYHKYLQEVSALKEQHISELRGLREEKEQERKREEHQGRRGEKEQDLNGVITGSSTENLGAAGQVVLEEKKHWERVEEEVAKVGGHGFCHLTVDTRLVFIDMNDELGPETNHKPLVLSCKLVYETKNGQNSMVLLSEI